MAILYYFDGRGRAEMIRLLLAAVETPEKTDVDKLRQDGKLVFGQVPMLEIDGLRLVQTGAINRYLARKAGMYGKTNHESTLIDLYYDGSRDFQELFIEIGFQKPEKVLKVAREKSISRYLPVFDKRLCTNNTGFLVGDRLTLADVGLLEPLLNVVEYFGLEILQEYPNLKNFYESITNLPSISLYLNGPQRKRPNDAKYIDTVMKVLYSDVIP